MGRRVVTAKDVAAELRAARAVAPQADGYLTRLMKYIPGEIVAGFLLINTLIDSAADVATVVPWIVFFVFLVGTPLYTWRVTNEPGKSLAKTDIVVATIAFAIWVFALGGPFSELGWYLPVYGSILLIIYTLAIPAFVGK
jgi:hypothetical protein